MDALLYQRDRRLGPNLTITVGFHTLNRRSPERLSVVALFLVSHCPGLSETSNWFQSVAEAQVRSASVMGCLGEDILATVERAVVFTIRGPLKAVFI